MNALTKLYGRVPLTTFAALFISATYIALGASFLALSPPVGAVLVIVGLATLGVFLALKRRK